MNSLTLYTIGHSNHSLDDFLGLLKQHAITDLVDIRSAPQSRFSPHFNKKRLESTLPEHGMTYHFSGEALGGRPKDPSVYTNDKVDFGLVMQRSGIRQASVICLLCCKKLGQMQVEWRLCAVRAIPTNATAII